MAFLLTFLSILIAVVGNLIHSVAFIIEKIGHHKNIVKNETRSADKQKSYVKNTTWIIGIFLYATGSGVIAVALSIGPQSLLVPLKAVTLVCNTYLAARFLGEPLRPRDVWATG